jgi:hypothetical protein
LPCAIATTWLWADATVLLCAVAGDASISALAVAAVARPEAIQGFLDTFEPPLCQKRIAF